MHHHPMPTGIQIMDIVMLKDADKLATLLRRHGGVDRILIGHLHRNLSAVFAASLVSCAPSTYRQVFLDLTTTDHGAFVDEPPGLLLHRVDKDRPTVTHYVPITHSGPPAGRIG